MFDLILEALSALVIGGIVFYLLIYSRKLGLAEKPGTTLIFIGFCLMLFGALIDITDEYPQFNVYLILGDTRLESLVEKFLGRMLGPLLILLGLMRILPVFSRLRAKKQLIETIVETIPAPTFCKDEKGNYLQCNKAFEEFIGFPREQIIGQSVFDISPPDLAEIYHQADQRLMADMGRENYEAQVKGADGLRRDVIFNKAVFSKDDGSAGGLVGVILDITERKKAEEGLRHLDRLKSEFISIAAHELRTPLTSIHGYTELLLDNGEGGYTPLQQQDFLKEIYQACDALNKLIDELLDVGRIERGEELSMELFAQSPEPLLQKVIMNFQMRKHEHQFEFVSALTPQTVLPFDEYRLRQVFENLLSNATKYSPDGGRIDIDVRCVGNFFQLEVKDQGIGMSPEEQSQIFEKFYRASNVHNSISGQGIGMSVVKSIVDGHGGEIEVHSEPGVGTCVRVRLPLEVR